MICPQCGQGNKEMAKFCNECGTHLDINCPRCSKVNPPESKFCSECGQSLNASTKSPSQKSLPEERSVPFQPPKDLTEKILAQKGRIEGERRKYEETVQEFRGGGIMALFGAPIALENAAQRAVNAALAIHQEVTKFSHRIQEEASQTDLERRLFFER